MVMTNEPSIDMSDGLDESPALPALTITPQLPKPGEMITVDIRLSAALRERKAPRSLVLEDADEGRVWAEVPTASAAGVAGALTVRWKLPDDLAPGLYHLVLLGSGKNEELTREELIIIDRQMEKQVAAAQAGLDYTLKAAAAKQSGELSQAITLLERSAREYQRAGSFQCAGFAFADAAALARKLDHSNERFEDLGWQAVELLLRAEDAEGAASVVRLLADTLQSVMDVAGNFIRIASRVLQSIASEPSDEVELERMQAMILQVANKALPQPGQYIETEEILDRIETSKQNQYILSEDELLSLAISSVEICAPEVLLNSFRGWGLNSWNFADALAKAGRLITA